MYFLCIVQSEENLWRFQGEAQEAYTCKQILGLCHSHQHQVTMVFANCSNKDVIYPLTVNKIAQAQKDNAVLKKLSKIDKYSTQW